MNRIWEQARWPVVRIRDIGILHGGGTPDRKRPEFFEGEIPWITSQDIPDTHVAEISTARDYVTEDAIKSSATKLVPAGTVLVSTRVTVGKTAVSSSPLCFSQDITAILIHAPAIASPRYVAWFLSSRRESLLQKNQGSTIAGITRDALELEQIPLPPLSEQHRIVEILREAEEIRRLRAQAEAKTAELIPALFRSTFGNLSSNDKRWRKVPVSHFVSAFQGGKSLVGLEDDAVLDRPRVLKISAVTSGVLNPTESKSLPSDYLPPADHYIKPGDLLITRANTEELVGATALVSSDCPSNLVLPDKIWRFLWREDTELCAEFVWALFQDPTTRKQLGNIASGTGGSMKNISMAKLMQMRVIWPPDQLRSAFSKQAAEILALRDMDHGQTFETRLASSLSAHAFSGELTSSWREAHANTLATEARERDAALAAAGAATTRSRRSTISELDSIFADRTDGIYAELTREQREVLRAVEQGYAGVQYARYFSARDIAERLEYPLRRNAQVVDGHLQVLATRGLLIGASREEQDEMTGQYRYANAYRLPLSDFQPQEGDSREPRIGDRSRATELERLAARIEKERMLS